DSSRPRRRRLWDPRIRRPERVLLLVRGRQSRRDHRDQHPLQLLHPGHGDRLQGHAHLTHAAARAARHPFRYRARDHRANRAPRLSHLRSADRLRRANSRAGQEAHVAGWSQGAGDAHSHPAREPPQPVR
ncbi:MAG: hypothetical protein E6J40_12745, partial [Chloroflexi bacterium]